MKDLFKNREKFNQPLQWDTSQVTRMENMFYNAKEFNQDLPFDTSKLTHTGYMFYDAAAFNGDLSSWDTSKVTKMSSMFKNSGFNNDISSWDTSSVTKMDYMFENSPFNQDITSWDTGKNTYFLSMFRNTPFSYDISCWSIHSGTSFSRMFKDSGYTHTLCWNIGSATDTDMFLGSTGSVDPTCTPGCAAIGATCSADSDCITKYCDGTCKVLSTTPVCDACPVPLDMKDVGVGTKVVCEDTSVQCIGEWIKYGGGCYHPTCRDLKCCEPAVYKEPDTTCASAGALCTRKNKKLKADTSAVCPNHKCTADLCCEDIPAETCQDAIDYASGLCTRVGRVNKPSLSSITCAKFPCKVRECCNIATKGCKTGDHCNVGTFDIHDESKCFSCGRGSTCTNKRCVCPAGFGGTKCDIKLDIGARQDKIKDIRASLSGTSDNVKKQRQTAYKEFVKDIVRAKVAAGVSLKQAVKDNMLTIAKTDLPSTTAAVVTKTPRVAAIPDNADQDDDCHLGASATNCGMVDLKDDRDNNQQTIVSVGDDIGSWSVVVDAGSIVSKQTRTGADAYDMQCWDTAEGDWEAVQQMTTGQVFECNNRAIYIGSQIGICDETTCHNGGTCAASGNTFTCICPIIWTGQICDVPNAGGNNGTSTTCAEAFDNADKIAFQNLNCACATTCLQ
tara:strand:- start:157 stop:2175 length:2019 start_codon:yes stop_codon:yes gene_type:complete